MKSYIKTGFKYMWNDVKPCIYIIGAIAFYIILFHLFTTVMAIISMALLVGAFLFCIGNVVWLIAGNYFDRAYMEEQEANRNKEAAE